MTFWTTFILLTAIFCAFLFYFEKLHHKKIEILLDEFEDSIDTTKSHMIKLEMRINTLNREITKVKTELQDIKNKKENQ